MVCSPQVISVKGTAVFMTPTKASAPRSRLPAGRCRPVSVRKIVINSAASPIRTETSGSGPRSSTATLISRNDDPHTKPNSQNIAQFFMMSSFLSRQWMGMQTKDALPLAERPGGE